MQTTRRSLRQFWSPIAEVSSDLCLPPSRAGRPHDKQLSCSSSALRVARWVYQTRVVSWDKRVKFMEAYWCVMVGVPRSGWALEWDLVIGYSWNQSPKQQLFFKAILDFALIEVTGALSFDGGLPHALNLVRLPGIIQPSLPILVLEYAKLLLLNLAFLSFTKSLNVSLNLFYFSHRRQFPLVTSSCRLFWPSTRSVLIPLTQFKMASCRFGVRSLHVPRSSTVSPIKQSSGPEAISQMPRQALLQISWPCSRYTGHASLFFSWGLAKVPHGILYQHWWHLILRNQWSVSA